MLLSRPIMNLDSYYFAASAVDTSKTGSPKTEILIDLFTARNFFGFADLTKKKLISKAKSLCEDWNKRYYKPYSKYQDAGSRSHSAHYSVLSEYRFEKLALGNNGKSGGATRKGPGEPTKWKMEEHQTQVILSLTNWWFVNKNKNFDRPIRLEPKDLHVTLKISSTVFAPSGAPINLAPHDGASRRSNLFFDRSGLILSFPVMMGLLSDTNFEAFVNKVFQEYQSQNPPPSEPESDVSVREADADIQEVDNREIPATPASTKNLVSARQENQPPDAGAGAEDASFSASAAEEEGGNSNNEVQSETAPLKKRRRPTSRLSLGDRVNIERLRKKLVHELPAIEEEEENAEAAAAAAEAEAKRKRWEEEEDMRSKILESRQESELRSMELATEKLNEEREKKLQAEVETALNLKRNATQD